MFAAFLHFHLSNAMAWQVHEISRNGEGAPGGGGGGILFLWGLMVLVAGSVWILAFLFNRIAGSKDNWDKCIWAAVPIVLFLTWCLWTPLQLMGVAYWVGVVGGIGLPVALIVLGLAIRPVTALFSWLGRSLNRRSI